MLNSNLLSRKIFNIGLICTFLLTIPVVSQASTDLTGSGTASASATYSSNSPAHAFDNNLTVNGWGNNESLPSWLKYDFGSGNEKIITEYTLYRNSAQTGGWASNNYSPKNWTFEGSNNNVNWVVLNTQSNQNVYSDQSKKSYTFSNSTPYRYYKINITSSTSGSWTNITEMEMIGTNPTVDTTPPVITLIGSNPQTITQGDSYTELGATAMDDTDGNITSNIVTNSSLINTNIIGTYTVTYNVSDAAGNMAIQKTRTVSVVEDGGGNGGGESLWSQLGNKLYYLLGNVGIGTDNPSEKLEVAGTIKATMLKIGSVLFKETQDNGFCIGDCSDVN